MRRLLILFAAVVSVNAAQATVRITEWMYSGANGEFIEFTNYGPSAVDFTGWSYSDNARVAGSVDLSSFGTVAIGESVILSEATASAFKTAWGLAGTVKVIGELAMNLGRSDEINIYDGSDGLVDRLTFNDQGTGNVDGPRTQNVSASTTFANLGANNASLWTLSFVGDSLASKASTGADIGNPGVAPVPEPGSALLFGAGALAIGMLRRRRSA